MTTTTPQRRTLRYDPALDGLRAIAVLSVMIYHGFVGWGRGGFLGVDLFFVLSGYLITTLMLLEHQSTGSISLGAFWYRRAKRLLPALFVVLAWIAVYAIAFAEAEQLRALRRDALATLAYVANWNFIISGQSYFDAFSTPSPLRHMWSLAIEEQWYLLWPIAAVFGLRRWDPSRWVWPRILLMLALASAAAQSVLARGAIDTSRAYYGTDVRAHALLLGAAMAFVVFRHRDVDGHLTVDHHGVQFLGWLGLAGYGAFFLMVTDTDRWMYNGGFFLVAIMSGAAILGTVTTGPHNLLRRVLSLPPLPLIGRLSYGLYLWHWPLYVLLTPQRTGLDGYELFGVRVAASTAAAALSYAVIERPLRSFDVTRKRMAIGAFGAIGLFAVVLVMATATAPAPSEQIANGAPVQPASPLDTPQDATTSVVVVGDSVAFGFVNDLPVQDIRSNGFEVRNLGRIGCGVFEGDYFGENVLADADTYGCDTRLDDWEREVATTLPDVTVFLIGGYELFDWELDGKRYDFGTPEYDSFVASELAKNLEVVTERGGSAVFLTVQCMQPTSNGLGDTQATERGEPERQRHFNSLLETFVAENGADASIIDLAGYTCPDGVYIDELEGEDLHRDGVHFTPEASALVWDWLAPQLPSADNGPRATGTISGTVTDSESGAGVAGSTVRVHPSGSTTYEQTITDANGDYTIELPTGIYKIRFSAANFTTRWWSGETSQFAGAVVVLGVSGASGIDEALPRSAGTIMGTVTDRTGRELAGATVRVYPVGSTTFTTATTGADGKFTIEVSTGFYKIRFSAAGHQTEWLDDQPTQFAGDSLAVGALNVASADAQLD